MNRARISERIVMTARISRVGVVASAAILFVGGMVAQPAAAASNADQSPEPVDTVAQVDINAPGAGEARDSSGGETTAAYDCSAGYICFYTGRNGTGRRCMYSMSNPSPHDICSWSLNKPNSVRNRTKYRVHYYTRSASPCSPGRIGSTLAGNRGNLAGDYNIRCLRFTS
jgi:hypothetical protein